MLELIAQFHWPTFFVTVMIMTVVYNILNIITTQAQKKKAEAREREADKKLAELKDKLGVEDKNLEDIINKFKRPSK